MDAMLKTLTAPCLDIYWTLVIWNVIHC